MDKEESYSAGLPTGFTGLDYPLDHYHHPLKQRFGDQNSGDNNTGMVDYMLNNPPPPQMSSGFCSATSLDRLSFAEVMQFADFGPKLAVNQAKLSDEENGIDPGYFLKFPVLNDKLQDQSLFINPPPTANEEEKFKAIGNVAESKLTMAPDQEEEVEEEGRVSENNSVQLHILVGNNSQTKSPGAEAKNRRKRPRTVKTSEEVESQRMTHIAVERNRRKQMNEHLRVLRSLMPSSYVQRGDQASIIGGAIEFVRELEQLLQCLESQKRRRLYGNGTEPPRPVDDTPSLAIQQPQPPFFPPLPAFPNDQMKLAEFEAAGLREETAENKTCLADVEVKLLGFDAMIKILSRRRPGQLLKTIAALEDLQLNILHTNITTIEQTVLYSFNVKVASESRFTAEDIASSVQQIFNFIHASTTTTTTI
ncbi:PREDICTED: transcription factor FAMA-like isoform X2 [Nelumbo nucifera]|uniref:Transcription factor FAMA-like isoform X2 n=1 Tax=Nelumbo nucifera TaxID=4432 RepID=A0A1U8AMX8_NELNU|nr:PREDICTED: transcription factor FAMA-like isoform X2 [Nelumbo nucifera]